MRLFWLLITFSLLSTLPAAADLSDVSIYSTTRYQVHSSSEVDDTLSESVTFGVHTGRRSAALFTLGYRHNTEDGNAGNALMGLTYIHSISPSSFVTAGYSNYRTYRDDDDGRAGDVLDAWHFSHNWKLVKTTDVKLDLTTSLMADASFDEHGAIEESVSLDGPLAHKIKWGVSYTYAHSFVTDENSANVVDLGLTFGLFRHGRISLGYRWGDYDYGLLSEEDDHVWIITYRHRLR